MSVNHYNRKENMWIVENQVVNCSRSGFYRQPTSKEQVAFRSCNLKSVNGHPLLLNRSCSNLSQNYILPKKQYTVVYVIKKGYFNLVRHLLDLGVNADYVSEKDDHQLRTPLILCTFIRDEKWAFNLAQNLLSVGASMKKVDKNRLTPIHYCCAFGHDKLLELFLNSLDFDILESLDINGNSCMHYALRSHNLRCVQLIIRKYTNTFEEKMVAPNATSNVNEKINSENHFGLRPIDLTEEIDDKNQHNNIYSGTSKLADCRNVLIDFLCIEYVAKMRKEVTDQFKQTMEAREREHVPMLSAAKFATAEKYSAKKFTSSASGKFATKKLENGLLTQQDETKMNEKIFFKTQQQKNSQILPSFEVSQELIRINNSAKKNSVPICNVTSTEIEKENKKETLENTKSKSNMKALSLKNSSHFNHFQSSIMYNTKLTSNMNTKREKTLHASALDSNLSLQQSARYKRHIKSCSFNFKYTNLSESEQNKLFSLFSCSINPQAARSLTTKSFLTCLKDFIMGYIDFNALFYNKEYLNQSAILSMTNRFESWSNFNTEKHKAESFKYSSADMNLPSKKESKTPANLFYPDDSVEERTINTKLDGMEYLKDFDWKSKLPDVFRGLENFLSLNHRDTVNPSVKGANLSTLHDELKVLQEFRLQQSVTAIRKKSRSNSLAPVIAAGISSRRYSMSVQLGGGGGKKKNTLVDNKSEETESNS